MSSIQHAHCPVCGSKKIQYVFTVRDHTVSNEAFELFHCCSCTFRFTQQVPDIHEIGRYYQSESYISHSNTNKGFTNQLYQRVRRFTMRQKVAIVKEYTNLKTGRLLDVGSGTGTFLNAVQKKGWEVLGLEPNADARAVACKEYAIETKPSHELFALPDQSFNAITLWHVLEHVHTLQEYMAQLKKLLATNGVLFIAVPNYTSKDAQAYEAHWAGYDVPRHLYHFSPQSMQTLTGQQGLHIIKILPMWFDSFYVAMLSSKYKTGKSNYISAVLRGCASNINAVGNVQECSSVIYVVKKNK